MHFGFPTHDRSMAMLIARGGEVWRRSFVGFIGHDHEPSQNKEHQQMSKPMVCGGQVQTV